MSLTLKFIIRLILNLIYLIMTLFLLGTIEKKIGVFVRPEENLFLLLLFLFANFILIYIFYKNYFIHHFSIIYGNQPKLSKSNTVILFYIALIILLVLTLIK